ncbi:B12-binding domain-containing radical SAM protein [Puniceicoccus vermicola]|uniref:Cobalamin B12-binding domain-containing protein n=1 Tax=Puniceicoccus vermicola TaxID=388746 RepID=A0A7X1E5N4_9BACT|nr:cobalamin B12-binding domain-containing protein [Puniceicoccus vermicola]
MKRKENSREIIPVCPISQPVILFSSVFGPFARDDEYGSRAINPMELYQNQVTRAQGPFSLRMFHRSWGLMLIRENIESPSTLLDFPSRDRFIEELQKHPYDIVAISAIPPNFLKVKEMCRLVRLYLPEAKIIVGGHITGIADLKARTGVDYVSRGEGVRWMRSFLGEKVDRPIRHPRILSGIGTRTMGMRLSEKPGEVAATLIPSVGCPMGCNFCATSATFGGKGRFIDFYKDGDELFEVMVELERDLKVQSFFVMDENFLFHRRRALRLLERMKEGRKSWSLYVFSSANVLKSYKIEQLVGLGISWVWMGLEGKASQYAKLAGADTRALVRELQSHGISILGSTIIGLEEHTPENLPEAIEYAVSHDTEFHQFMLYTPVPGTPLFEEHREAGTLLDPEGEQLADAHGQLKFMHRHPNIPAGEESGFLLRAFQRDFEVNGPSVLRMARTLLQGWRMYGKSEDGRVRTRLRREARSLAFQYAAAVAGARRWFRKEPEIRAKLDTLLREIKKEFGLRARLAAAVGRVWVYRSLKAESRRLGSGFIMEPPTFRESSLSSAGA